MALFIAFAKHCFSLSLKNEPISILDPRLLKHKRFPRIVDVGGKTTARVQALGKTQLVCTRLHCRTRTEILCSETVTVSTRESLRRQKYKASPNAAISMPAKGRTNHSPCNAKADAIAKETQSIIKKKIRLPRHDSDWF